MCYDRRNDPDCALPIYIDLFYFFFFFNDTATTEIYTLSLHDALPIYLATVTNSNEQDWLLIQSLNDGASYLYIGGFQDTSSPDYTEPGGGWTWVTEIGRAHV